MRESKSRSAVSREGAGQRCFRDKCSIRVATSLESMMRCLASPAAFGEPPVENFGAEPLAIRSLAIAESANNPYLQFAKLRDNTQADFFPSSAVNEKLPVPSKRSTKT